MGGVIIGAARVVVIGLVGAIAYDGLKRVTRSGALRGASVTAAMWGLRGVRAAEIGGERVRLAVGDVIAEARGRIGEQAPAPGAASGHEH
ncbi:DUF1490 family protein [Kutzneria buriramensis]|uniref:Uncharacterized protein DUF1490 n=1 Tax=Kutzneria buriramensis TaxID=1045776 RepID=A0A3E0HKH4_9PSEU|nr:DUF1490 family protein [Kutzneria buriramensis]REH46984.1 uncharacterized protein DUF1490 [Kutzneria buriramensis]